LEKVRHDLSTLQKAFPNAIGVTKLTALVQLASKEPDAARATYLQVLTAAPGDLEALTGLMQLDLGAGHAKEAAARVDERVKQSEPRVELLILAARTHAAAGGTTTVETPV